MKLNFGSLKRSQPDPFIFEAEGKFYLYVTAIRGVEVYSADTPFSEWKFEGEVFSVEGCSHYWAPSIVKVGEWYYLYVSCEKEGMFQHMHAARAKSPLGPFGETKKLFDCFSIDSHVTEYNGQLILWYAADDLNCKRVGTRIYADRLIDPFTPARQPRLIVEPTFDEEIFLRNRYGDGRDWHTIEGAFWFEEGGWQYVMYSGACYQNDTYHIGYASAPMGDPLTADFVKHTDGGKFSPLMTKNEYEEGVGHHSVLKYGGEYYAVYHGRDADGNDGLTGDRRTARICRLHVKDGVITAERYHDKV